MKKALIIFAVMFIMTMLVPFAAIIQAKNTEAKTDNNNELVTIFSSHISLSGIAVDTLNI